MKNSTSPPPSPDVVRAVSEVVVAFLAQRPIEPEQLPALLIEVRRALTCDLSDQSPPHSLPSTTKANVVNLAPSSSAEPNERAPPVPMEEKSDAVGETVFDEYLICLEDGKRYRSLKRHLMSKYGMTPDQYRAKWNLPGDYPMVAPSYARARSEVAKRIGLGRPVETRKLKSRSSRRRA